jgi:hypothetical protein
MGPLWVPMQLCANRGRTPRAKPAEVNVTTAPAIGYADLRQRLIEKLMGLGAFERFANRVDELATKQLGEGKAQ